MGGGDKTYRGTGDKLLGYPVYYSNSVKTSTVKLGSFKEYDRRPLSILKRRIARFFKRRLR